MVLEVVVWCQRSPCSSAKPTAMVSMCTKQEESLDPDPGERTQMRHNWIIHINTTCELLGL